jgi:hypothetical protein
LAVSEKLRQKLEKKRTSELPGSLVFQVNHSENPELFSALTSAIPISFKNKNLRMITFLPIERNTEIDLSFHSNESEELKFQSQVVKREMIEEKEGLYHTIELELTNGPFEKLS